MGSTPSAGQNRKSMLVLLGFLLLGVLAFSQDLPTGRPESVGLSSERRERIRTVVQRDIDDKRLAGAVTLLLRRGHVAWSKAQGMMDREAGKPMATDAKFRVCSVSKPRI